MKLQIRQIILTAILTFIAFIPNVFAKITIKAERVIKINDQTVYKLYDNLASGEKNIGSARGNILELEIDGQTYVAYCIDFGINNVTGTDAQTYELYEYFSSAIGDIEAKELIKKITMYARFGYGFNGKNSQNHYLATQQLIWEAVNATGFYQSEVYEERSGKKYNIANFGWSIDKTNKIDLSQEINAIKTDVRNYYITPSFCNENNKLEIEVAKTVTYTDKNGVLSSYKTICDNDLECSQEGNNLVVTAKNNAGKKKIEFIKEISGTENVLYRVGNRQSIISSTGLVETVTCDFGINSFQNVQTSDSKIIYISIVGLFCGCIAYFIYKTKHI